MVYVIQVCWQLATDLVPSWSCSQAVWHITLLCVQWKTPDDGQRNCPKHVEFYSKNKFQKFVNLVCLIRRIYHVARSPERNKNEIFSCLTETNNFIITFNSITQRDVLLKKLLLASSCVSVCLEYVDSHPTYGREVFLFSQYQNVPLEITHH